jgi:signal transduction histidine kinase
MKPLLSESQDTETLQELGRASVQIVHDLKNQLNGLKLYATFLRKRMEKSERPADEQETIAKIIAGLERAANDTTALVRYGRPIELRRRPTDLRQILRLASGDGEGVRLREEEAGPLNGEFDAEALREAFESITAGARKVGKGASQPLEIEIHVRREAGAVGGSSGPQALIEWRGAAMNSDGADPFRSFAGSEALRMAVAAKIVRAHGGEAAAQGAGSLMVRLPLSGSQA